MWETIKNDPWLKAITIIILGILGFGFAFNIMFGQRNGGAMDSGEMGGGTYDLGNTLSYILAIAFKLLLIAIVIILIIAIVKFTNKYLLKGEKIKMGNSSNNAILKILVISVLVIIGTGIVWMLMGGIIGHSGYNGMNGYNTNNMMNGSFGYNTNNMMNGNYGNNAMGTGTYAIAFLLKALLFVSVVGLIVGAFMFLFKNFSNIQSGLKNATVTGNADIKLTCETCGTEIKSDWKCCPKCGKEKATVESNELQ